MTLSGRIGNLEIERPTLAVSAQVPVCASWRNQKVNFPEQNDSAHAMGPLSRKIQETYAHANHLPGRMFARACC